MHHMHFSSTTYYSHSNLKKHSNIFSFQFHPNRFIILIFNPFHSAGGCLLCSLQPFPKQLDSTKITLNFLSFHFKYSLLSLIAFFLLSSFWNRPGKKQESTSNSDIYFIDIIGHTSRILKNSRVFLFLLLTSKTVKAELLYILVHSFSKDISVGLYSSYFI